MAAKKVENKYNTALDNKNTIKENSYCQFLAHKKEFWKRWQRTAYCVAFHSSSNTLLSRFGGSRQCSSSFDRSSVGFDVRRCGNAGGVK